MPDQDETEVEQADWDRKIALKFLLWLLVILVVSLGGCFEYLVGFREFLEITDKPENGLHIVRHDNGHKLLEGNYENGQKIGQHTMWHANGMVKSKTYFEKGKKNGTSWGYYVRGALLDTTNWVDGEMHGVEHTFFEEGRSTWSLTHYKHGKKHGEYSVYHKPGEPKETGSYIDGFRDGSWKLWYENGKIRHTFQYTDGYRQGVWVFYDEDGQVEDRDIYKDSACVEDSCEGECLSSSGRHELRTNDPNCERPILDGGNELFTGDIIHPEDKYPLPMPFATHQSPIAHFCLDPLRCAVFRVTV